VKLIGIVSVVALVLLLALVGAGAGCGSNGGGGATDMMKKIPEDATYFNFIDIRALRADDDLKDLYRQWEGDSNYLGDEYDIDTDDVSSWTDGGNVTLLAGSFGLDDVREKLDKHDYAKKDEYKGVEVWESEDGYEWVALMNNLIIIGSKEAAKDCIRVIREGEHSLQHNLDVRDVMDKLQGGITVFVSTSGSAWYDEDYEGLEASSMSLTKKDKYTLQVSAVFKFVNDKDAEAAMDEIKSDMKGDKYKNVDLNQDGEYVKITAEMDIEDFLD
jgi:hypothetical protein